MKLLGPQASATDDLVDLTDLTRFSLVTPKLNAWYYANAHGAVTGSAQTLNRLDLGPFPVLTAGSLTIKGLAVVTSVAGAAGSVGRIGVYADDGSGYPGALKLDTGTFAMTSVGVVGVTTLGSSLVLTPGLYWIGLVTQTAAPTVFNDSGSGSVAGANPYFLNSTTTTAGAGTGQARGYGQTSVTAALPSTFTSTLTALGSVPRVLFKT